MSLSDPSLYDSAALRGYARKIRKIGGIVQLSIVPDSTDAIVELDKMPQRVFDMIVGDCEAINGMGVPVFLNFAPDMNANYYKYKLNPESYKAAFKTLADLIRGKKLVHTGKNLQLILKLWFGHLPLRLIIQI